MKIYTKQNDILINRYFLLSFKVITLKGVLYGDMFRYAKNPIWKKVYEERMKNDFDSFPEVVKPFNKTFSIFVFRI